MMQATWSSGSGEDACTALYVTQALIGERGVEE
jgi:hypothetical protein